jgi:hypothetical protein
VEITGIAMALLDIRPELTQEFNRWYDLDHLAEHVSKGDVVAARRYVAPRPLRRAPGVQRSDWVGDYPPYMTMYLFGGPLDFMSDDALALWRDKDRWIVREGRYWIAGTVPHISRWRIADAVSRPSVLVSRDAVPHLAHRGIIIAVGRAPSADRVQEAVDWWDKTHLVDLFAVPGVLAAMRFTPVEADDADVLLHVLLCEQPPAEVMAGIEHSMRYQRAIGRFPAHGGVYERMAFLPYDRIVPLEYEFDIGDDEEAASSPA